MAIEAHEISAMMRSVAKAIKKREDELRTELRGEFASAAFVVKMDERLMAFEARNAQQQETIRILQGTMTKQQTTISSQAREIAALTRKVNPR